MIVPGDADGVRRVVDALRGGQVCAIPTDTLYALAASLDRPAAIERIFRVKRRTRDVVLPVLCADLAQADGLGILVGAARAAAERFWPGPLTIVCPRRAGFDADLGESRETVGLRVPDHDRTRAVLERTGPLASSSANLHGEEQPETVRGVAELFGDGVPVVLDDDRPASRTASTVVRADESGRIVVVLRRGDVDPAELGL